MCVCVCVCVCWCVTTTKSTVYIYIYIYIFHSFVSFSPPSLFLSVSLISFPSSLCIYLCLSGFLPSFFHECRRLFICEARRFYTSLQNACIMLLHRNSQKIIYGSNDTETNRPTDRQTDRQIGIQRGRWTNGWIYRQVDSSRVLFTSNLCQSELTKV